MYKVVYRYKSYPPAVVITYIDKKVRMVEADIRRRYNANFNFYINIDDVDFIYIGRL